MTALTTQVPPGPRPSTGTGSITLARVIRSEWIKLRSVRSTWFSLLALVVILVGLGTLFSGLRAHRFDQNHPFGPGPEMIDATLISLRGTFLAQLAIGVLGVLVITGEYSTGQIHSSLSAVPRRLPVLVAKAFVFGLFAFVVCGVSAFCAFLAGQQALASTHQQANLGTHEAVRAIFGAGLYLTLIGLMGIGLGFIIRSTAGAIAALMGVVLVLPLLAQALPSPYDTDVSKYLPLNAGTQILQTRNYSSDQLSPWIGLGLTAAYAIGLLIVGAVTLRTRDA